jgi:hypothetical protein
MKTNSTYQIYIVVYIVWKEGASMRKFEAREMQLRTWSKRGKGKCEEMEWVLVMQRRGLNLWILSIWLGVLTTNKPTTHLLPNTIHQTMHTCKVIKICVRFCFYLVYVWYHSEHVRMEVVHCNFTEYNFWKIMVDYRDSDYRPNIH